MRAADPRQTKSPTNIGFFGQLSHFKGVEVLLEAMALLDAEDSTPTSGSTAPTSSCRPQEFQDEFAALQRAAARTASPSAAPTTTHELPKLMADLHWVVVPSIWWENSPLVIQEAFFHRRPVICSDVGGMAEKVRDGVDGLHFRVGDPYSLARTIEEATANPRLWRSLRDGIREPYPMDAHVARLMNLYGELLEQREEVALNA